MRCLVAVCLVLLTASCEKRERTRAPAESYRLPLNGAHTVYFIKASDGTRCAIYGDGGITCDWQHSRNEVE